MNELLGLGYCMKLIGKSFEKMKTQDILLTNLSSQQINIIMYISKHVDEEINQKRLEEVFELSNATVSGIVKRLEENGYVKRICKNDNRRNKIVSPTEKSLILKNDICRRIQESEDAMLDGFSVEEKKTLMSYLNRMYENIKEEEVKYES